MKYGTPKKVDEKSYGVLLEKSRSFYLLKKLKEKSVSPNNFLNIMKINKKLKYLKYANIVKISQ